MCFVWGKKYQISYWTGHYVATIATRSCNLMLKSLILLINENIVIETIDTYCSVNLSIEMINCIYWMFELKFKWMENVHISWEYCGWIWILDWYYCWLLIVDFFFLFHFVFQSQISLAALATTNLNGKEPSLVELRKNCLPLQIDFWQCMNRTLHGMCDSTKNNNT